jgi:hypothetical protein
MRAWLMAGIAMLATTTGHAQAKDGPAQYWVQAERFDGPTVILLEPLAERSVERLDATRTVAWRHGFAVTAEDPKGAVRVWLSSERWMDVPQGLVRGYVVLTPHRYPLVVPGFLSDDALDALLGVSSRPPPSSNPDERST